MARPIKNGLDYFPLDVGFFDDDKIAFVNARFGGKGEMIALKLLCKIYKDNGYYYQWGADEAILFAKRVVGDASQHSLVNDVVHELVKRDFFSKDIFDRFKILTSHGIQKRYDKICKDANRIGLIDENLDLIRGNPRLCPRKPPVMSDKSTQRKGKEIKEKKIKVNKPPLIPQGESLLKHIDIKDSVNLPFNSLQFNKAWTELLNLPKWKKKPAESLQKSLNKLNNYDEAFAIELINRAIEGNYQGLVFQDTDNGYVKWKSGKKGHAMTNHTQNAVHDNRF